MHVFDISLFLLSGHWDRSKWRPFIFLDFLVPLIACFCLSLLFFKCLIIHLACPVHNTGLSTHHSVWLLGGNLFYMTWLVELTNQRLHNIPHIFTMQMNQNQVCIFSSQIIIVWIKMLYAKMVNTMVIRITCYLNQIQKRGQCSQFTLLITFVTIT